MERPRSTKRRKLSKAEIEANEKSRKQLARMMNSIRDGHASWFGMGQMRATNKLANGARVFVRITMPPLEKAPRVRKSAQEQAYDDIAAGKIPHNKHTCPGCPIH